MAMYLLKSRKLKVYLYIFSFILANSRIAFSNEFACILNYKQVVSQESTKGKEIVKSKEVLSEVRDLIPLSDIQIYSFKARFKMVIPILFQNIVQDKKVEDISNNFKKFRAIVRMDYFASVTN